MHCWSFSRRDYYLLMVCNASSPGSFRKRGGPWADKAFHYCLPCTCLGERDLFWQKENMPASEFQDSVRSPLLVRRKACVCVCVCVRVRVQSQLPPCRSRCSLNKLPTAWQPEMSCLKASWLKTILESVGGSRRGLQNHGASALLGATSCH